MRTVWLLLLLAAPPAAQSRVAPAAIDWPEFFSAVHVDGIEYSDRLRKLEGTRVRLRGYSIRTPKISGALLLSREAFAASDAEETEIPFDAVGVIWRQGTAIPPIPARPTVEGTLRLGNRELEGQIVAITLEDAVPVYPPKHRRSSAAAGPRQT